jgi:hypothetical protein
VEAPKTQRPPSPSLWPTSTSRRQRHPPRRTLKTQIAHNCAHWSKTWLSRSSTIEKWLECSINAKEMRSCKQRLSHLMSGLVPSSKQTALNYQLRTSTPSNWCVIIRWFRISKCKFPRTLIKPTKHYCATWRMHWSSSQSSKLKCVVCSWALMCSRGCQSSAD